LLCSSDFPSILGGFPHSEIVGSKGIRTSPTLIAAYHVLHRLCMPRHPPIALKTLDCSHCQCPSGAELRNDIGNKKDQLLEICSMARLGKPIICGRLSVSRDEPKPSTLSQLQRVMDPSRPNSDNGTRTNLLFTISYRTGIGPKSSANLFSQRMTRPNQLDTNGGAGRDRTDDPLLAKQVLSQLSYSPLLV
jgi:hypothetical protein